MDGLFSGQNVDLAGVCIVDAADHLHRASVPGAFQAPGSSRADAVEADLCRSVTNCAEALRLPDFLPGRRIGCREVGTDKVNRLLGQHRANIQLGAIRRVDSHVLSFSELAPFQTLLGAVVMVMR
ncbi:hypothetical protein [Paracoccus haematequi]|uniref:hypothetical protein n=1 Tax=Paracoccus haematequi TaxID=2491866 RepID=UPI003B976831